MFVTVSNHAKRIQRLRNCVGFVQKIHPCYAASFPSTGSGSPKCVVVPVDSFYLGSPPGKKARMMQTWDIVFFKMKFVFFGGKSFKYMEDVFEYVFLETSLSFHMKPPTKMCHDEKRRPSSFLQMFFETTPKSNGWNLKMIQNAYVFRGVKFPAYLQIGCVQCQGKALKTRKFHSEMGKFGPGALISNINMNIEKYTNKDMRFTMPRVHKKTPKNGVVS